MSAVAEIFHSMSYGPAPEESAYAFEWIAKRLETPSHFIAGGWRPARRADIECRNPARGELLGPLGAADAEEVDAAVQAAKGAFAGWAAADGHQRARHLYALARLIQKNSRFLAVLESIDNGKPLRETRDLDIPLAARHFYHHAGWAQLCEQEFPDHAPLGVVGQIIPWNFPLLMLAWKIAPALAAGNTVVLKPAEYTSLTALAFAELCQEAGLPHGVVNIVTGAGETGALLSGHPDVAKVAFTGSTEVGRLIRRQTAGTGKKLSLELGGKSPFIVFEDADLDSAVEGLVDAIWFNQGQVCCAGSRLLVEESVAETLYAKIRKRLSSFRIGDPLDKAIDMGALVDPIQHQRITSLVARSVAEGAQAWSPEIPLPARGCFYPPTLLTNLGAANIAMQEEIFGPVLAAMSFRTLGEALSLANNSRYGLAATIWSENINKALEVAAKIKAGVVWINTTNAFDAACGFGGYRESGFGREGGREGMLEYLELRDQWGAAPVTAPPAAAAVQAPKPGVDQTAKHFIAGKQKRPDGARTVPVHAADGRLLGRVGLGNRKDIRDAVEAAAAAEGWATTTGHARAQILYFLAENLSYRAEEFAQRIAAMTLLPIEACRGEVEAAVRRLFAYAAWADKFDGLVHSPPQRSVVLAVNEPVGVVGVVCPDEAPLLAFVSLAAPLLALGNRCVVVPSERFPLAATDFYQVVETSDVPPGVLNIVTGDASGLARVLADHDGVDGLWFFRDREGSQMVEERAAANMKRTWVSHGRTRNWHAARTGEGREFLRRAAEIKNIWLPYGD